MTTTLMLAALAVTVDANAKVYRLDPVASGVSIDGALEFVPVEISVTSGDFVLTAKFRNTSDEPLMLNTSTFRCMRGDFGTGVNHANYGLGERWMELAPGATRSMQMLCDHGADAAGDIGIGIPEVFTNPSGYRGDGELVVSDVEWWIHEDDLTAERQRAGESIVCLKYRRPPPPVHPGAVAVHPRTGMAPLAIPGNLPSAPPASAAPPPPPPPPRPPPAAAALRPRAPAPPPPPPPQPPQPPQDE